MAETNNAFPVVDQRLFRFEIRAAVAHCDALFRAGILTRFEAEQLKNGLRTILKRADFDSNYLNQPASTTIFEAIESRLCQLVNEAASALKIKRAPAQRAAIAVRLWMRDEIEAAVEALEKFVETLGENRQNQVFKVYADALRDDCERFGEILPRVNRMPKPELAPDDEATAEIDFDQIADELDFAATIENAPETSFDSDFAIEFAGATAFAMLHLSNLANEILRRDANLNQAKRRALEAARASAARAFGHHAALLALSKGASATEDNGDFEQICALVFDAADTLRVSLAALAENFKN